MQAELFEKVEKIKMLYRILIFAVTILLIASAFVFLVYLPKTEAIAKTNKEITRLKQQINRAKITARNLKNLEKKEAEIDTQFKEALKLLPNKREIPSLLRNVTQLGRDSNLNFRLFQPMQERPKDFFIEIPVSVEVTGSYHDVAVFFDKVGRMKRIVNIIGVSMRPVQPLSTKLLTRYEAITFRFKGKD